MGRACAGARPRRAPRQAARRVARTMPRQRPSSSGRGNEDVQPAAPARYRTVADGGATCGYPTQSLPPLPDTSLTLAWCAFRGSGRGWRPAGANARTGGRRGLPARRVAWRAAPAGGREPAPAPAARSLGGRPACLPARCVTPPVRARRALLCAFRRETRRPPPSPPPHAPLPAPPPCRPLPRRRQTPAPPAPVFGTDTGRTASVNTATLVASLPASATEVSTEAAAGGAYRPLAAGMSVAGGLEGSAELPPWFRLNLSPYGGMQAGTLVRTVTYQAVCGAP